MMLLFLDDIQYLCRYFMSFPMFFFSKFYDQGGWGWLVVGAAFLVQVLTTGLQLAFGVMAAQITRHFRKENAGVHMEAGQNDFIPFTFFCSFKNWLVVSSHSTLSTLIFHVGEFNSFRKFFSCSSGFVFGQIIS